MNGFADALVPYAEFARVGFVNILAFRLRYFTGIITYFFNVTIYYFIWTAFSSSAAIHRGLQPAPDHHLRKRGLDHPLVLLEHDRPGNGVRSDRRQDRDGFDQAGLGAMDVDLPRDGRIRVSPRAAHGADGDCRRAGLSGARTGVE